MINYIRFHLLDIIFNQFVGVSLLKKSHFLTLILGRVWKKTFFKTGNHNMLSTWMIGISVLYSKDKAKN